MLRHRPTSLSLTYSLVSLSFLSLSSPLDLRLLVVLASSSRYHHHLHSDLSTSGHLLPDRASNAAQTTSQIRGQTEHQRTTTGHRSGRLVPADADRQKRGRH